MSTRAEGGPEGVAWTTCMKVSGSRRRACAALAGGWAPLSPSGRRSRVTDRGQGQGRKKQSGASEENAVVFDSKVSIVLHVCMYARPIHSQEPVPGKGENSSSVPYFQVFLILTRITMTDRRRQ